MIDQSKVNRGTAFLLKKSEWGNHNLINSIALLAVFVGLVGIGWLIEQLHWVPAILLGIPLFGILFFTLYILVVHEASHRMLFLVKGERARRWINRLVAYPICALGFQDFYLSWEKGHHEHHRAPVEDDDPQNCPHFCHYGKDLWAECLKTLFLVGYAFQKQSSCITHDKRAIRRGLVQGIRFWGTILLALYTLGYYKTGVAMLASSNVVMVLNLIKVSMEHGGHTGRRDQMIYRSKSSLFPLRSILMPLNISLHFEHHLNPRIPWYRLPRYHRMLRQELASDIQEQVYNLGARQTWKQITQG